MGKVLCFELRQDYENVFIYKWHWVTQLIFIILTVKSIPQLQKMRNNGEKSWKNKTADFKFSTFHVAPEISETFLISSFFLFIKFLFLLYFILQYCIGFAIHWHESTMGVHAFPNMNPSSHLPPHNISLGHPRAPAPSMLYPASDIDWRFDSYMIVYMFQCHSPKSSHPLPLPLPLSPKVCYTHLCLFCSLAYRVVIAIFLNSIYMC